MNRISVKNYHFWPIFLKLAAMTSTIQVLATDVRCSSLQPSPTSYGERTNPPSGSASSGL
jgi:hypothetical protein